MKSIGRYIVIGLVTAAPLAVTWLILSFLFDQLSQLGRPLTYALGSALLPQYPALADFVFREHLQSILAAIMVLSLLYFLGWGTTRVVGRRIIAAFERVVGRIPLVQNIYRATKRFLMVANPAPEEGRRVVLIEFPSTHMRTLGFLTRILKDERTGEELAAVYVPTAPNPTSGYVEIVRVRDIIFTEWTFDQAVAFIVTGGASAPEAVSFSRDLSLPNPS